jgi:TetR/AcrR family transcriptional repressor of lmrAB and yxaGH operons
MVETTAALLRRQGYAATGWRTVVEEAGTPWGSAHHHFPGGKEQLAAEAIALGGGQVAAALRAGLKSQRSVADTIRAWFALSAAALEASDFTDGCPLATVALETAAQSPTLGDACHEAIASWEALLAEALVEEGTPPDHARKLAITVISSLEGALLLARVHRSTAPLHDAAEVVDEILSRAGGRG